MILFYLIPVMFLFAAMALAIMIVLYLIDGAFGGWDFTTSKAASRVIGSVVNKKFANKTGIFVDLGCCRGDLALNLKNQFPQMDVYGIDNSLFRLIFAKVKANLLGRQVTFLKQDFFSADVSGADLTYIYLDKTLLPRLEKKLKKELKPGATVITSTNAFPGWQPISSYITNPDRPNFEKLFVYEKV